MKPSSGTLALVRIFVWVIAITVALGYFAHVRAQSGGLAEQGMVIPLRPLAPLSTVPVPPVFGMEGILADKTAAIELGKALFWDMQAGSDDIQACASCHFNAGADSRANNEVNPGQAGGDNTFQLGVSANGSLGPNYHYSAGTAGAGFGGYHDGDFPFRKLADVNDRFSVTSDVNDVSGSQGQFGLTKDQITVDVQVVHGNDLDNNSNQTDSRKTSEGGDNEGMTYGDGKPQLPSAHQRSGNNSGKGNGTTQTSGGKGKIAGGTAVNTNSVELTTPVVDPVFSYPSEADPTKRINTRRVTGRNTPSAVDAVFNFRNFWDGRAQNVCNGANPFGTRDKQNHLLVVDAIDGKLGPTQVNMVNSALCSQSLGPILSATEMSADDRNFHQVGKKLLARVPLANQLVDPTDSVLGVFSKSPGKGLNTSYSALVQKAFQPEWWQFSRHICEGADGSTSVTVDPANFETCAAGTTDYSQMEYNFSLFWGVAIQMYESTLVADQTPFDKYMEQQQSYTLIGDNLKNQYTIQLKPGVTPYTVSIIGLNPTLDASDQDMYAFDDGQGTIRGVGVNGGSIDYASGTLTVFFGEPPVSLVPIHIGYSVGAVPLTNGQLRGLNLFQTKAGCVVCHGGPELSNASVGTVTGFPVERMIMEDDSARVYDTGYYHIGVRPTAEDAGLAGNDPVAGLPLSQAEILRQHVCDGGYETVIVPGRRGDGIAASPMNCNDDIARGGFFKAPQLRNVALTAPYFHNGSQLTLEQVVEFYNRGGDFNTVEEVKFMDPDIEMLGLTEQDKLDLVDFLRNGLTDPRTVAQAAPFDHPQLFAPNGHPHSGNGYPVTPDPKHPDRATDQLMEIPAVGAKGGKPLPTFLENLLGGQNAGSN
ncbi:MAG TPA: cytochrome c peroxidase [Candidatus Dormibacteraeota bacterium]|nr:cytochrome c peroxidase [Candidatus Dormibacteraeota bacterium]